VLTPASHRMIVLPAAGKWLAKPSRQNNEDDEDWDVVVMMTMKTTATHQKVFNLFE
jgi:hypothetical protein